MDQLEGATNVDEGDGVNIVITPVETESIDKPTASLELTDADNVPIEPSDIMRHLSKMTSAWGEYLSRCDASGAIRVCHLNRYEYGFKHIFYKKHEAYAFSDKHGRLPVFSVDISNKDAAKAYIVTGYKKWWVEYKTVNADKRYAYEVVLADMPCHLYVDMEAEYRTNPELKPRIGVIFKRLMDELISFMYDMQVAPRECLDKIDMVVLDSSKPVKFSKHCILKIPETLFENNYYCGAFIRRFQMHMLSKYGPKDTNPFFIRPDNKDKQAPEFKIFLIDMGVYTKGRDFRLLGSYKRTSPEQRFLWIDGAPNRMNVNDFFDALIQFQAKPGMINYYVSHIVDTINGGVPHSSSLKTVAPLNHHSSASIDHSGNAITRCLSPSKRQKNIVDINPQIVSTMMRFIQQRFKRPVVSYKCKGHTIMISSTSHQCDIKGRLTNTTGATHAKNVVYYMVIGTNGLLLQSCYNNSYCYDFSKNKHRTEKLGVFRDKYIVDGLIKWCDDNGWDFTGDLNFVIPDHWIGTD